MSKILILMGSPRKEGNTDLLAQAFADGAKTHHETEIVRISDYKINPCLGCNCCFDNGNKCCQKDDMDIIYDKMKNADIVIIASPVYFYGISGNLKALIDRFHNPIRDTFRIKKLGLILVGAASLPELFDAIITQYKLILNFFKLEDGGMVLVRRAKTKGDVKTKDELKKAFEFGEKI